MTTSTATPTIDRVEVAVRRGSIHRAIMTCRACPLAPDSGHEESVARVQVPFRGPAPTRLMIVGDSPSTADEREGTPFSGRLGYLFDRMMVESGLLPLANTFTANAVCCRSKLVPSPSLLEACRPHLRAQVALADPAWVLLLGNTALASLGVVKDKITKVHGRPFLVPAGPFYGRLAFATFHPAAALRDEKKRPQIMADLSTLRALLAGRMEYNEIGLRLSAKGRLVPLTKSDE